MWLSSKSDAFPNITLYLENDVKVQYYEKFHVIIDMIIFYYMVDILKPISTTWRHD